jgi:hypothetical protein
LPPRAGPSRRFPSCGVVHVAPWTLFSRT